MDPSWCSYKHSNFNFCQIYCHLNRAQSCINLSQSVCFISCLQDYIATWCKLCSVPIIWLLSPSTSYAHANLPDCNIDNLNSLKSINSNKCLRIQYEFPGNTSKKKCPHQCEYYLISFSYIPMVRKQFNKTSAALFVDPYRYPVTEEFFLISLKQFVGSLGGNLNLYLGASFVTLFHSFYFWMPKLFQSFL